MTVKDPDPAAVKREFEAFKSDPKRVAQFSKYALLHGYLVGLEQARTSGVMPPALFSHEYRRYFDILLGDVREALKEIDHIGKALRRMEAAASQGKHRPSVERLHALPDDADFQHGLLQFQAWLASLFETYVSIMGVMQGANGVTDKVKLFASDALTLIQKRHSAGDMTADFHGQFRNLTEL